MTYTHTRYDSSGPVISPTRISLPDNTQQTDIQAPGGIRTRNPSKQAAVDPRLRLRGHRSAGKYITQYIRCTFYNQIHHRYVRLPANTENSLLATASISTLILTSLLSSGYIAEKGLNVKLKLTSTWCLELLASLPYRLLYIHLNTEKLHPLQVSGNRSPVFSRITQPQAAYGVVLQEAELPTVLARTSKALRGQNAPVRQ